jgi:hypothetical protein
VQLEAAPTARHSTTTKKHAQRDAGRMLMRDASPPPLPLAAAAAAAAATGRRSPPHAAARPTAPDVAATHSHTRDAHTALSVTRVCSHCRDGG